MKRPITAGGEAMPAAAKQEQIAQALRGLEDDIRAVMLMSDITADAWDKLPPHSHDEFTVHYRLMKHERDCFEFMLNDVAVRAKRLHARFEAGLRGEMLS